MIRIRLRLIIWAQFLTLLMVLAAVTQACASRSSGPYVETFDSVGQWGTGRSADVEGSVEAGVYELLVKASSGLYLASAGESFADGIYEVDATQLSGPLNSGYGMLLRYDETSDSFYAFQVSGDGFVWIGRCRDLCETENVPLVAGDWFRSPTVKQGLQETNRLLVVAEGPLLTFFVNGIEVGRVSDSTLPEGDIAVAVETLGERGVRVTFDNFKVTPLESD